MIIDHGTKCNVIDIDFKNPGNKISNSKVIFPNAFENIETSVSTPKRKNTTPQILICNQCPKSSSVICFVDQSALDNHIKNVHRKLELKSEPNDNIIPDPLNRSMPDFFQNMIKTVQVVQKSPTIETIKSDNLNRSMPDFFQNMIKTVQVVQKPPAIEAVQKKPVSYNYRCNVCGLRFAEQQKMMSHLVSDHAIKL
jgi:transcription elongation factor Elf1